MSVTRTWRIYGAEGHRQRISFDPSFKYDFSGPEGIRILECDCADRTGTNEYVDLHITRSTAGECESELVGQLSDGIFENSRTGNVLEIIGQTCTPERP